MITQTSGSGVGLVIARTRLVKMASAYRMATNLITNARDALKGFLIGGLHCWLDSTVALHWIKGAGEYKQFVGNCVRKIHCLWLEDSTTTSVRRLGVTETVGKWLSLLKSSLRKIEIIVLTLSQLMSATKGKFWIL